MNKQLRRIHRCVRIWGQLHMMQWYLRTFPSGIVIHISMHGLIPNCLHNIEECSYTRLKIPYCYCCVCNLLNTEIIALDIDSVGIKNLNSHVLKLVSRERNIPST